MYNTIMNSIGRTFGGISGVKGIKYDRLKHLHYNPVNEQYEKKSMEILNKKIKIKKHEITFNKNKRR